MFMVMRARSGRTGVFGRETFGGGTKTRLAIKSGGGGKPGSGGMEEVATR